MIVKDTAARAQYGAAKMGKSDLARGEHLFCGLNAFRPGQEHEPHTHCDRDKSYVVLSGSGQLTVGDETREVGPGDFAFAAAGAEHALRNSGNEDLVVFVTMSPPPPTKP